MITRTAISMTHGTRGAVAFQKALAWTVLCSWLIVGISPQNETGGARTSLLAVGIVICLTSFFHLGKLSAVLCRGAVLLGVILSYRAAADKVILLRLANSGDVTVGLGKIILAAGCIASMFARLPSASVFPGHRSMSALFFVSALIVTCLLTSATLLLPFYAIEVPVLLFGLIKKIVELALVLKLSLTLLPSLGNHVWSIRIAGVVIVAAAILGLATASLYKFAMMT